jgi:hypothetical protein
MDPLTLLNYDSVCRERELLVCLWEVKIHLFIAPFAFEGNTSGFFLCGSCAGRCGIRVPMDPLRLLDGPVSCLLPGSKTLSSMCLGATGKNCRMRTGKVSCICSNLCCEPASSQHDPVGCHIDYRNPSVLTQWTCLCFRRGASWGTGSTTEEAAGGFVLNGIGYM